MNVWKSLLLTVACVIISSRIIAQNNSEQAERATHYIEGDYSVEVVNNQFIYKLQNITSQGISFTKENVKIGNEVEELAVFEFERATTNYPTGFASGLKFWKWDYENSRWQIDSETKDGQLGSSNNKVMTIMLVLDCSGSLTLDGFTAIKAMSEMFIKTIYSKSNNGNVRLGIIGFNTMAYTNQTIYPITELNPNTYIDMISFIRRLEQGNQTAMYYAMHKALDIMEAYTENLSLPYNVGYDGNYIVTFTDGYDNNSRDPKIGVPADGLQNPYFKYVRDTCLTRKFRGKPIVSTIISIEGPDVGSNSQKFREILKQLSTGSDNFYLAKNFDELQESFKKAADKLIDRWNNLICFVPPSYQGKVRWTLGYAAQTPPPPIPDPPIGDKRSPWFGISAEVGMTDELFYGVNLDMAFSINESIAIGGRVGATYDDWGPGFLVGPEMKYTFTNNSAIIAGFGGGMVTGLIVGNLRTCYKTRKSIFFTADFTIDLLGDAEWFYGGGVGIGFSFGGKPHKQ